MPVKKKNLPSTEAKNELENIINKYGSAQVKKELQSLGVVINKQERKEKHSPTLVEAVNRFLNDEFSIFSDLSPGSKPTYESEMKIYCKFYGVDLKNNRSNGVLLKDVLTPVELQRYLKKSTNNMNTRNKKAAILRSFIISVGRDILTDIQINRLFNKGLEIIEPEDELPRAFTASQVDYLLKLARLTRSSLRNFTILWTLIGTGIRVDELHFQIGDVNLEKGWVKVKAKGKKDKNKVKRYMTKGTQKVLKHYIDFTYSHMMAHLRDEEYKKLYVFSDDQGRNPLSNRAIQKMIKKLIDTAIDHGVINNKVWDSDQQKEVEVSYSTHSFRHTFAVYALEGGMDVYIVQQLLGHKSIASTEKYLKLFDDQYKKALEKHPFAKLEQDQLKDLGVE